MSHVVRSMIPLVCAGLLTGCATGYGGPISGGQEALSPQERRLQSAETRIAELSRRLDAVNLTGMDQDNQRIRDDMRSLRGEVESLRHEFDQAQRRARDQYLDLDRRLQRFENPGAALSQATPPAAGATVPAPWPPSAPVSAGGFEDNTPPPASEPAAVVAAPVETATPEEERAYLAAFDMLKEGKYDEAIRGFRGVLERWPNGRYAGDALYWTGETYYVKRDYKSALTAFQTVGQRFPTSTRAPDSLLKVGLSQLELKQAVEGQATLARVIQMYPQTNAARLAQQRLGAVAPN